MPRYVTSVYRVLYQDRRLVVIDKPAGIPSTPTRSGGPSIAGDSGFLPCHRLDTATSGVLVLARQPEAQRQVSEAFEARRVRKGYLAHAVGTLSDRGSCTIELGEWARGRVKIGRGRAAETRWNVRDRHDRHLLVEANPVTGRTHQVRAHLSASGAPLWGDEAYGGPAATTMGLHAWWIELPWPGPEDRLRLQVPPPPAFVAGWGMPIALEPDFSE